MMTFLVLELGCCRAPPINHCAWRWDVFPLGVAADEAVVFSPVWLWLLCCQDLKGILHPQNVYLCIN